MSGRTDIYVPALDAAAARRWAVGIACGLLAGALWGLVFVAPRMLPGVPSVDLTAGRFVCYGAMAAIVMLLGLRTRRLPNAREALAALGLSVLGFTGYYLLLVLAVRDAGTEMPALIIGTIPVWVMLLGKPQGLRWAALLPGLVLTVAGLALMAGGTSGTSATGGAHWGRGIALSVAALACWTAFAVLNAAWLRRNPQVSATDWANWLGVATGVGGLLLWSVAGSAPAQLSALLHGPLGAGFVVLALALGIGSSWLATILWNIASQRLSASLCGQLIVSETLFALVYSFLWDGQWPTLAQAAAALLFTLGILASIKAHR